MEGPWKYEKSIYKGISEVQISCKFSFLVQNLLEGVAMNKVNNIAEKDNISSYSWFDSRDIDPF
jgi:hypothetical protein